MTYTHISPRHLYDISIAFYYLSVSMAPLQHLHDTHTPISIGSGMEGYPPADLDNNVLRDVNKLSQQVPATRESFYSMLV